MQNFSNLYKIHIETLGCRLNQIESESIAKSFSDVGFSISMESVTAKSIIQNEVIISVLNTCTVTQKSEQKARRIIRLMLEKFPQAVILVTGCYAQLNSDEIAKIDKRIFVIGGQIKSRITKIPQLLTEYLQKQDFNPFDFINYLQLLIKTPQLKQFFPENTFKLSTSSFFAHSRASLKIQDGCNNNCSYCAIHLARGKSVSIDVKTALERVIELENKGYDEVVLTTVNIGQYRGIFESQYFDFKTLLKYLLENTKKIRFRISSLYPEIIDDSFCDVIKNPRVQPHFHISVQSGSNKILSLMNRRYSKEEVITACKKLKNAKNDPFLACDIITGFPGETDSDFEETMQLCKECGFVWVHAFPYSQRPGTEAVNLNNKVPQYISGERAGKITQWAISQKIDYCNRFVGKKLPAILESVKRPKLISQNQSGYIYHAVTENFLHCLIHSSCELHESKAVCVEIQKVLNDKIQKGGDLEVEAKII
ncbi:MAG: tRNA (N(6)-L-threonylcarbamoyladenosine(37)-C(2))-methylthiotransferase MtaB [Treponema sp.]|nr:tRNA (N(6)-L-threonylcarbamoyladenosine(37)-C(2))-methylthiotransferase MtaB [Spirochaetales bacterium]MDY6191109.1 tRNA (N(6)-L-threonylcarbamoyladenosine(37)-C(2))-methylthiotransferase MtaB [Treponema sp.]